MTPRQRQLLDFITAFHHDRRYSPTYAEMCVGLGWKSRGSAFKAAAQLVEQGMLIVVPGGNRNLVPATSNLLREASDAMIAAEYKRRFGGA